MHVSVVMTVYNGETTVSAAVRSIVEQTYSDWDLVVVDDASTDGTAALLEAISADEPRICLLRNPRNLGAAASRNRSWRHARGELIAILDADDLCEPDRLARQAAFLLEHPEVDVLGSDAWLVDEQGTLLGRTRRPQFHAQLAARMYRETPFIHPTVMLRRRVMEESGGYDDRLRWSQDSDLWLRLYRRFRFHNLGLPLVRYRVRSRMSLERIAYGAYVLLRAAHREGRVFSRGWYTLRWLAAMGLARAGLRETGLRAADPATINSPGAPRC